MVGATELVLQQLMIMEFQKLISVGAGANFYFSGYKDDNKDITFCIL